ncbi:PREDICTED: protein FAM151B isoform X2 [Polistes dominula]|nr:PREDICTED: protein FAM151B isoform X2 [Polistes dominula]
MCDGIAPDPKTFFQGIKGNLTNIVWAHAVNSKENLAKALTAKNIMMLEADVVLGYLTTNSTNTNITNSIPIMAHPPETESDLSLEEFLMVVLNDGSKGIKLDFKSIEAFDGSKSILANKRKEFTVPLFLNADILPGPVDAKTLPVNSTLFLESAMKTFPESVLSVGWTTRYGSEPNITEGQYTEEHIQNMVDTLTKNKVTQSVTYPVRAGLAAGDINVMKTLIDRSSSFGNATLTIWSSQGDNVDTNKLSELIKTIGIDKVYVDVPQDVWMKLDLSNGSSTFNTAMMTVMTLISFLFARML